MGEKCFPDTELKLVQNIDNEHAWNVKISAQFINKCILRIKHKAQINNIREFDIPVLGELGTEEVALRRRLTAAPAMAAAEL